MHIQDPDQKAWIQARMEAAQSADRAPRRKRELLEQLVEAEGFERFLHVKYPGTKRFGLDGGESTVPALEAIIRTSVDIGVDEIVIGMPHRGRLNVLANVMGKPYPAIFSEFQGGAVADDVLGSGDVKYHLGLDRELPDGGSVHLSLTANPSHLEAVNPWCSARCAPSRPKARHRALAGHGLLLHGDAAFAGQGVVHEGLEMSELRGFRTGGTIHLIVNNQIGFTTSPAYARSSPYPSDGAQRPGADLPRQRRRPRSRRARGALAAEFRQKFKKDVVVDLWCYRRHMQRRRRAELHPAADVPQDRAAPTTRQIYTKRLVEEGVISEEDAQAIYDAFQERMSAAHESAAGYKMNKADWLEGAWSGLTRAPEQYERGSTAVPLELIRDVGLAMTTVPETVHLHRKLERIIGERRKSIESGTDIDWATAEHLAFGTLLREGFPVRLSGQDSGRGTFSQRHAILYDQTTEERYIPLAHLHAEQAPFEVVDSPLSEAGVLGFEYGYSLADPNSLVLWEAQFGDFATAPRSTSTSSSRLARPSGCACRGWSASCPTVTKGRAGAQLGAPGTLPAAVRRRQHPGPVPVDSSQLLSRATPADALASASR